MRLYISLVIALLMLVSCDSSDNKRNKKEKILYEVVDMYESEGLVHHDYVDHIPHLEEADLLKSTIEGNESVPGFNHIEASVSDGVGGFYMLGTYNRPDSLKKKSFTQENFDAFIAGLSPKRPAMKSALLHYDKKMRLLKVSKDFKSDVLFPADVQKTEKGIAIALESAFIADDIAMNSVVIILDQGLKEQKRVMLKNFNANALIVAKNGDILCSGLSRDSKKGYGGSSIYRETLVVLNSKAKVEKRLILNAKQDALASYATASHLVAFKNGYVVSGVDHNIFITEDYRVEKIKTLYPQFSYDQYYYIKGAFVTAFDTIALFGHYGYEGNPNLLDDLPDPNDPMNYLGTTGPLGMSGNRELQQMIYSEMYREFEHMNSSHAIPFKALILSDKEVINTVRKDNANPSFQGSSEPKGFLYVEQMYAWYDHNGEEKLTVERELYDYNLSLRFKDYSSRLRCQLYCSMIDNTLIFATAKYGALYLHKEHFNVPLKHDENSGN